MALNTEIQNWRTGDGATAAGTTKQISKLKIGNDLYSIKDPAVEQLASMVETRLSAVENKTSGVTAVTKGSTALFATSVTQNENGQLSVEYGNIRSTALEDTAVDGQFITTVSQGIDGQVSIARAGVTAGQVLFDATESGFTATTVAGALDALYAADKSIIGTNADGSTVISIYGARAYADYVANQLAGQDWTQNAQTIQNIINELEGSTGIQAWDTVADKVRDLSWTNGSTTTVYNTVKDYVDARVQAAESAASGGITDLDAEVGSTAGQFVNVTVKEVDGKITKVDITENNIASATALSALDAEVVKSVNGITATNNAVTLTGANIDLSGSTAVKLDTYVTGLGDTKANKAAITAGEVSQWSVAYTSGTETLEWTSATAAVYVPVSGQTL